LTSDTFSTEYAKRMHKLQLLLKHFQAQAQAGDRVWVFQAGIDKTSRTYCQHGKRHNTLQYSASCHRQLVQQFVTYSEVHTSRTTMQYSVVKMHTTPMVWISPSRIQKKTERG